MSHLTHTFALHFTWLAVTFVSLSVLARLGSFIPPADTVPNSIETVLFQFARKLLADIASRMDNGLDS
jgi:hypothetical protein